MIRRVKEITKHLEEVKSHTPVKGRVEVAEFPETTKRAVVAKQLSVAAAETTVPRREGESSSKGNPSTYTHKVISAENSAHGGGVLSSTTESCKIRPAKKITGKKKQLVCICPICLDPIKYSSSQPSGQDAFLCEGACRTWLHLRCAALSKEMFQESYKFNTPISCLHCKLQKQDEQIAILNVAVTSLTTEISSINERLNILHKLPTIEVHVIPESGVPD